MQMLRFGCLAMIYPRLTNYGVELCASRNNRAEGVGFPILLEQMRWRFSIRRLTHFPLREFQSTEWLRRVLSRRFTGARTYGAPPKIHRYRRNLPEHPTPPRRLVALSASRHRSQRKEYQAAATFLHPRLHHRRKSHDSVP